MAKRSRNRSSSDDDTLFESVEPVEGFKNLPKGEYEGYIKADSATLEPKDSGGHTALMTLIVTEGAHKDETQTYRQDLTSEFGRGLFLGALKTLELGHPKGIRDAAKMLVETDNLPVRFYVSAPKDENPPNVRINELLEGGKYKPEKDEEPEEPEEAEKSESASDEDWTAKSIADLSEKEMTELAEEEGLNPDDFTWEELEAELVDILC